MPENPRKVLCDPKPEIAPKNPENPRPIPEIWQFCVHKSPEIATSNACKSLANTGIWQPGRHGGTTQKEGMSNK